MIDARELRVGNWTQFNNEFTWLDGYSLYLASRGDIELDPIPLTPEILEKAGFKKLNGRGKTGCYRMGDVKINIDNISIAYIKTPNGRFMELVRFKYVHQLQNIVHALTNQEIKI